MILFWVKTKTKQRFKNKGSHITSNLKNKGSLCKKNCKKYVYITSICVSACVYNSVFEMCRTTEVSICIIECVWPKERYSESHLSAAVCTEARGGTTGMQCLYKPVHLERGTWRLHTHRATTQREKALCVGLLLISVNVDGKVNVFTSHKGMVLL